MLRTVDPNRLYHGHREQVLPGYEVKFEKCQHALRGKKVLRLLVSYPAKIPYNSDPKDTSPLLLIDAKHKIKGLFTDHVVEVLKLVCRGGADLPVGAHFSFLYCFVCNLSSEWGTAVDINTATEEMLLAIPGFSRQSVKSILKHRKEHGSIPDKNKLESLLPHQARRQVPDKIWDHFVFR